MKSPIKIVGAAALGIFVALNFHLLNLPLKERLEHKLEVDIEKRRNCIKRKDLVCVSLLDSKIFHLNDLMQKNQHLFSHTANAWPALLFGTFAGILSAYYLPAIYMITLLVTNIGLYIYQTHHMSLSTIIARSNTTLANDATTHAYDCHRIVKSKHPTKTGHTLKYIEPLEKCLSKKTKDMQRLKKGIVPAIKVT